MICFEKKGEWNFSIHRCPMNAAEQLLMKPLSAYDLEVIG